MNIQSLLNQIKENSGMSDAQIGALVGAPQATINRLVNGVHKSTNFERGEKIKQLAEETVKKN